MLGSDTLRNPNIYTALYCGIWYPGDPGPGWGYNWVRIYVGYKWVRIYAHN